jgi:hypothetical protein
MVEPVEPVEPGAVARLVGRPAPPPRPARRRGMVGLIVVGCLAAVALAGVGYLWLPGGGLRIFSELHDRAGRLDHDPPAGLALVRRQDHGTAWCPFECGPAFTTVTYRAPGVDAAQLCARGVGRLTELFGPPDVGRTQPGGCGPQSWYLPGVNRSYARARLTIARASEVGEGGSDPVLVVTFDSGRA